MKGLQKWVHLQVIGNTYLVLEKMQRNTSSVGINKPSDDMRPNFKWYCAVVGFALTDPYKGNLHTE
jgi:hypothetical protein